MNNLSQEFYRIYNWIKHQIEHLLSIGKEPTKEWLLVCDLMLESNNLNISDNSVEFLKGLYKNLDPYDSFLNQQSEAQLRWLKELHENHIKGDASW